MKLHPLITLLSILTALFVVSACHEEEESTAETPAAETAPEAQEGTVEEAPAAPTEPAAQPAQADQAAPAAGGVCARAQSCCEAYVQTVAGNTPGLTVDTACAAVRQATGPGADVTCQAAIDGWRQALTASQQTVPESCAAAQ